MKRLPTHLVAILLFVLAPSPGCDSGEGTAEDAADTVVEDTVVEDTVVEDTTPPEPDLPTALVRGATGRIGHIVDGDTLDVWIGNIGAKRYTIRMLGISAPECTKIDKRTAEGEWRKACALDDEFYGQASYEALLVLAEGKDVQITCDNPRSDGSCPTDDFGRSLAFLLVDGKDLATAMTEGGHALAYTIFDASKIATLCRTEYAAQDANRGMWASGSVSQVINMMSEQTQSWYFGSHDRDCDKALGR
ncbi:MAG: endonuclease YncB(thermonuclease family) [Myxococcota bacterium]|jgi:endonuclease YncB( thermonuclease family)